MDGGSGRYAAFLSYSHKDAAAARWLHRKLETYRIPRRLVGKEGERGPVPARLTPIFRDREELPAAGDLSERVRAALAASDNLVILCSPNGAASPWVAKEIAAFRELHPDRPVFAAIVEGEPPLCFPANLAAIAGAEPLAADLRPHADGRRLGFFKLVAGLSGIGLDALVQRDAQRRLRRVTAVTGAALAAMLIMAVLTGIALSQRREAQRQRAEAEGLVEFMLTDLRTKLRGVGRVDIMQAVNARALRHYGQSGELGRLSDDALARRARILRAIGEDEIKTAHLAEAEAAVLEAYRITAAQLARRPDDPQRQLEHAHSEYWVGRLHEVRHDWSGARTHYSRFARVADQLAKAAPANVDYVTTAASASVDLGNLQLNALRDYEAAQAEYEKAVAWFGKAARLNPTDPGGLRNQANAYAWLADSFAVRGLWQQSLKARLAQYRIVESLQRSSPDDFELLYRLTAAQRGLAVSQLKSGDMPAARAHLFQAYHNAIELTARDPRNSEWLLLRAQTECSLLYAYAGLPPQTTTPQLRQSVERAGRQLRMSASPLAIELAPCLAAISKSTNSERTGRPQ